MFDKRFAMILTVFFILLFFPVIVPAQQELLTGPAVQKNVNKISWSYTHDISKVSSFEVYKSMDGIWPGDISTEEPASIVPVDDNIGGDTGFVVYVPSDNLLVPAYFRVYAMGKNGIRSVPAEAVYTPPVGGVVGSPSGITVQAIYGYTVSVTIQPVLE